MIVRLAELLTVFQRKRIATMERCYCQTGKKIPLINPEHTNIADLYIVHCSDGSALVIQQAMLCEITDDCKIRVKNTQGCSLIDIKYCPFCGRKL